MIVRFAPSPGPPEKKEAAWYTNWLTDGDGRCVIYVPRDYDAEPDYWDEVLADLDKGADAETRGRIEDARKEARDWVEKLPRQPKQRATPEDWFAVSEPSTPPVVCKTLGGPWGEDLDPGRVALPRHEALKVESETLLLEGDSLPLAIQWHRIGAARVLVMANGSFLLNGALLNRARRPLAERVADWVGDPPRRVAFVEGGWVLGGRRGPPSVFELLRVSPFGWVAAQMLALGLAVLHGPRAEAGPAPARGPLRRGPPRRPPRGARRPPGEDPAGRRRPGHPRHLSSLAIPLGRPPRAERRRRSSPRLVPSVSSPGGSSRVPRASCDNHSSESPRVPRA